MASGSFGVSTSNGYISGRVDWSSTTNVSGNYSTVTATLYLSRTNSGYETWGNGSFTMNINGNQKTSSGEFHFTYNSNTVCVSHTVDVGHNSDGTKSITITASGGISVFSVNTASSTVGLDTIPRASYPTLSAGTFNMGTTITINTNRVSSSFTHTLVYVFGADSANIAFNVTDSCTWSVPLTLANQIPNSVSGIGSVVCHTYNGGTYIGTHEVGFTTNVPSTVVPTLTAVTHSENVSTVSTAIGKYVQGMSKLNLAITGATGIYSSTISAYKINVDGQDYNSQSAVSNIINGSGSLTITATITDSRGRTATKTATASVLPYTFPKVTEFTLSRCNSDGTINDLGTYCKVVSIGSVSSLLNGTTEKNTLTYTVYSKLRTDTNWTSKKSATITGISLNLTNIVSSYTATSSYDFRLDITDKFNTTLSLRVLPTGEVAMSWSTSGVGIGKIIENGALDVDGDIYEKGTKLEDKYSPAGIVQMYAGGTLPSGWLLCNGLAISRTAYSRLFDVIGTTYGIGDGSTTFNLPNLKGRFPVGVDAAQTEFNVKGKIGGEKTHTLTANEMPSHDHSTTAYGGYYFFGGNGGSPAEGSGYGTQANTLRTGGAGGGAAHNTLPPYITLNFIIKT